MCITALPPHLNSPGEIEANFRDDSQFSGVLGRLWRRFKKATKASMAYGPRDIHRYHRWRKLPMTLLAVFGPGESRWESSGGEIAVRSLNTTVFMYTPWNFYLSRIQCWCDWSIQLQWPLFLACHYKLKSKALFFYVGCKRDADEVYWFPSVFVGLTFK